MVIQIFFSMQKIIDPILSTQLGITIISLLYKYKEIDFHYIKKSTNANSGNISFQIKKLQEAGYIIVYKSFKNNYPNTKLQLTEKGLECYKKHAEEPKCFINKRI